MDERGEINIVALRSGFKTHFAEMVNEIEEFLDEKEEIDLLNTYDGLLQALDAVKERLALLNAQPNSNKSLVAN